MKKTSILFIFFVSVLLTACVQKQRDVKKAARYYCEKQNEYSGAQADSLEQQAERYKESLTEKELQVWESTVWSYRDSVDRAVMGMVQDLDIAAAETNDAIPTAAGQGEDIEEE